MTRAEGFRPKLLRVQTPAEQASTKKAGYFRLSETRLPAIAVGHDPKSPTYRKLLADAKEAKNIIFSKRQELSLHIRNLNSPNSFWNELNKQIRNSANIPFYDSGQYISDFKLRLEVGTVAVKNARQFVETLDPYVSALNKYFIKTDKGIFDERYKDINLLLEDFEGLKKSIITYKKFLSTIPTAFDNEIDILEQKIIRNPDFFASTLQNGGNLLSKVRSEPAVIYLEDLKAKVIPLVEDALKALA